MSESHQNRKGVVEKYSRVFLLPSSFTTEPLAEPNHKKGRKVEWYRLQGSVFQSPEQGEEGPSTCLGDKQKVTSTRENSPNDKPLNQALVVGIVRKGQVQVHTNFLVLSCLVDLSSLPTMPPSLLVSAPLQDLTQILSPSLNLS